MHGIESLSHCPHFGTPGKNGFVLVAEISSVDCRKFSSIDKCVKSVSISSECSTTASYRHWVNVRSALHCACRSHSKGQLGLRYQPSTPPFLDTERWWLDLDSLAPLPRKSSRKLLKSLTAKLATFTVALAVRNFHRPSQKIRKVKIITPFDSLSLLNYVGLSLLNGGILFYR